MKLNLNTILSVFNPKDTKFIPLLSELSSIMMSSSALLCELFATDDKDHRYELCRQIKAEEVKGDKVSARILKELNDSFITPFDREDIDALADRVESTIDTINRVAQKVLLYAPEVFPLHTLQLTEIIQKGTLEIDGAVSSLSHLQKADSGFRKHYKEIKILEETADVIYEQAIMSLFKEEKNTVELIKLKEIIQELEKTANKINNAGKVLKTIFVKYA
jgi:predicted phosphate transport protein (TIGR00153 family)